MGSVPFCTSLKGRGGMCSAKPAAYAQKRKRRHKRNQLLLLRSNRVPFLRPALCKGGEGLGLNLNSSGRETRKESRSLVSHQRNPVLLSRRHKRDHLACPDSSLQKSEWQK